MKTLTQAVLPIAIIVGLIGGVTFVAQYSRTRPRENISGPKVDSSPSSEALLVFPVTDAVWELIPQDKLIGSDDSYRGEFEVHSPGHYDFWFSNTTAAPVELKLAYTSCGRCTKVGVGFPQSPKQLVGAATCELAAATAPWPTASALLATEMSVRTLIERDMTWQDLPNVGAAVNVPAAGPDSPGIGLLRLGFEGAQPDPSFRLAVDVLASQDGKSDKKRLTVPVAFVPALQLDLPSRDGKLEVGELSTKEPKQTVVFHCWSSTRDNFRLDVAEAKANPCFECLVEPLTGTERSELAAKLAARKDWSQTRVRQAYRVTVNVHERREGSVLDLGPFQRRLLIKGPDEYSVLVGGLVKGEVSVRSADNKGTINLGGFKAMRGTSNVVTLESERPDLELKLLKSETKPDYLKVDLKADGAKRWQLTVAVPPGKASGRLPEDSAVILQTQGEAGRRMRIPVTGEATQ